MFVFFLSLLGVVFGSFLGLLFYRLPRKENFIYGRSKCPECLKILCFYDLVPVISWLVLRGRCRYCKNKISASYIIIEILTGFLFFSVAYFANS